MLPFFISDEMGFSDEELLLMCAASGGKTVEATATGNPLTFVTDLAKPLKSLLIPFTPIQSGTGDPSPSNIRSILPWNGLKVWNGKNLLDEENVPMATRYIKYTSPTSAQWSSSTDSRTYKFEAEPNTTYTIHAMNPNITVFRVCALENGDLLEESTNAFQWDGTGEKVCTITTSATEHYLIIQANKSVLIDRKGYIFVGKGTAEENPITETDIVFHSSVYGGTLDVVSGVLTVEWAGVDLGSKSWRLRSENQSRQVWECVCNDARFVREGNTYTANAISSEFSLTTSSGTWSVGKFAPSLSNNDKVFIFVVPAGSYANATECKEAMDGIQLCYELGDSAKQEIQLTPQQITALIGDNTIWSDADGQMTAVYLKKG